MNTPNSDVSKQTWHTPQAYILRGAAAGAGFRGGDTEATKLAKDQESADRGPLVAPS